MCQAKARRYMGRTFQHLDEARGNFVPGRSLRQDAPATRDEPLAQAGIFHDSCHGPRDARGIERVEIDRGVLAAFAGKVAVAGENRKIKMHGFVIGAAEGFQERGQDEGVR